MKHKIIFLVLIFHLSSFIFHLPSAQAEGLSLSVSPSLLQVKTFSPADAKSPITLKNLGNNSVNIQVLFKPFRASRKENGEIVYINDNEIPDMYKRIFNQIRITDNGIVTNNFELGPKQKKNLELQFTIPKNETGSDYYFSVIFLARRSLGEDGLANESSPIPQNPPEASEVGLAVLSPTFPNDANIQDQNFSIINAGIAINILLSIGGKNHPQGAIEEFSAPTFIKSGPIGFTVRIKNIGSRIFAPKAIIFIKNMFGQTVGRVDIKPDNILADSIRALTALAPSYDGDTQTASSSSISLNSLAPRSPSEALAKGDGVGSTPKAIWPEKFLLGPYTATLNIAISDKGPAYNQSIVFLALPIQLILGIILGILITITIFLRVRYHLKNDK